jgi:preprotein translocase subunit SecG
VNIFLTVVLVVTCFVVVASILLQPAKGSSSSAFGGGSSQSLFGSAGATSFLFKASMYGGLLIMAICLIIASRQIRQNRSSVVDLSAPAPVTNTAPAIPAQGGTSVPDPLAPAAPAAKPSTPASPTAPTTPHH